MGDFAIYTPKMGVNEKTPKILLDEAFLASDSRNTHEHRGYYSALKGRIPLLYDSNGVKIKTPKYYFAITAVSTVDKKFTVAGAQKTTIEANYGDGWIRVNGSTGNDRIYAVDSITEVAGPATEIVVKETVADGTVDGNIFVGYTPVICYHKYQKQSTGTSYLLAGTAYHVWLWNDTSRILTPKFTSGTPASVTRMEMVTHLDNVYMTNNVDKVQVAYFGNSISNSFGVAAHASGLPIGGGVYITKAKHIISYETYLFVGYVTYSTATVYPQRAHWCSRGTGSASGSPVDYDETGAGDCGHKDFAKDESFLRGFGIKGNDLIVAKEQRMVKGWLTTADTVFEWVEEYLKIGCAAADTIINDRAGRMYWLASDFTIRELDTPDPISDPAEITLKGINPEQIEYSQATYIDDYSELWFAFASAESETNDLIVAINTRNLNVFIYEIPIRCFGQHIRSVKFTYDTLPFRTYESWGAEWLVYDTKVNRLGYAMDVCGNYSGESFEMRAGLFDNGDSMERTIIISTTLTNGKNPYNYKRIGNGMALYFKRGSDELGRNFCTNSQFVGSTGWVAESGWTIVGGKAVYDLAVDSARLTHTGYKLTAGKTYTICYSLSELAADTIMDINGVDVSTNDAGRYSTDITPAADAYLYFNFGDGGATLENVTIFEKDSGGVNVYTKKDTEKNWTLVGDASQEDADEPDVVIVSVPFNKRARIFYIKLETYGLMDFIGAVVREVEMDGDR